MRNYGMFSRQNLPILVTSFNRPDCLHRVLIAIKAAGCTNLYFASDGPRNKVDELDIQRCIAIFREYFPEVPNDKYLLRGINLGCRLAMYENIKWFFGNVEYGVVLEDDCLPSENFFDVMIYGLTNFASKKDIFMISGYNPIAIDGLSNNQICYIKSIYPLVWGWGSWSNRMSRYSLDFRDYGNVVHSAQSLSKKYQWTWSAIAKWRQTMKLAGRGVFNTWDYSLTASAWRERMYSLHPSHNLIENIGFDSRATHTTKNPPSWATHKFERRKLSVKTSRVISYGMLESIRDQRIGRQVFSLHFKGFMRFQISRARMEITSLLQRTKLNQSRIRD